MAPAEQPNLQRKYDAIASATSVEDVVAATRQYLSTWNAQELLRLPEGCRPVRVATAADIELWADRLLDHWTRAVMLHEDEGRLERITSHFLIASVRLRQLAEGLRAAA